MSGDIGIVNSGAVTIGAGKVTLANHVVASLDGTVVKVLAEYSVIGGIPVIYQVGLTAGGLGDKYITITHKIRVFNAHVIIGVKCRANR